MPFEITWLSKVDSVLLNKLIHFARGNSRANEPQDVSTEVSYMYSKFVAPVSFLHGGLFYLHASSASDIPLLLCLQKEGKSSDFLAATHFPSVWIASSIIHT